MGFEKANEVIEEVKKAVKGKDDIIRKIMTAILADGHILMEDIPGVGKTTLALSFSKAMMLSEKRMQFTSDVLPSDVVGFSMYNSKTQEFNIREGAVICNLFLADEINRTSSKTQSALLEAMEEGQVTVDGNTITLPKPFTVIATQNPVGSAGTQMLPESQLDRFMVKLSMGYPDFASEVQILMDRQTGNPVDMVKEVVNATDIIEMQNEVSNMYMQQAIYEYIIALCQSSRNHPAVALGISPRGCLAVAAMARANAYLSGRGFVTPEDVIEVFEDTVSHRILLNSRAKINGARVSDVVNQIVTSVPVPRAVVK